MPERELQIDHRVPYEIAGYLEKDLVIDDFMLLSGSANRAKSWSCENCNNWIDKKDRKICLSCYWAYPENYSHIAMKKIRRIDLLWQGKEVSIYEKLRKQSKSISKDIQKIIKEIIRKNIK